jgi:hypothetical protein
VYVKCILYISGVVERERVPHYINPFKPIIYELFSTTPITYR